MRIIYISIIAFLVLLTSNLANASRPESCDQVLHSDHIIFDCYKDWAVRHVFDRESLQHRYSDAKTIMSFGWFNNVEFQVNRKRDGSVQFIIPLQIDRVDVVANGNKYSFEQSVPRDTFYGDLTEQHLNDIALSKDPVVLHVSSGGELLDAVLSEKGSSAALRWIRAID